MQIFLAITLYDGKIHGKCSESLLKNCLSLIRNGHTVIPYYNSDLYIDRSRNLCVDIFLSSDCSDLIFIDSDLSFDDDAILKLIKHDKDIVAGAYRYKKSEVEFPVVLDFSRDNNCKEEETGLVYAKSVPTGFMRIRRGVFDRMSSYYKMKLDERGICPFFQTGMIFKDDNNWYGEDSAFCKKWREMGGQLFIEPDINFTHIGTESFTGNYHRYLLDRRVDVFMENIDKQDGINGWTTEKELAALSQLASRCDSIVEIGCWKGRSTKALLEYCRGKVYAVDHWMGNPNQLTEIGVFLNDVYAEFMSNVGHYPNLVVLKGDSVDMCNHFNGDKVDMVFIDGDHSYDQCKSDIEAWLPKCTKFICGHDYKFPGVFKAVNEKFDNIQIIDDLWIVKLKEA